MLIAKITESDFFGGEPQYIDDDARYNTRGVMTDGEGNIAMMKIEDSKYYKLPGGSIEITETPDKAFLREATEETGYPAELLGYLGWVAVFGDTDVTAASQFEIVNETLGCSRIHDAVGVVQHK